MTFLRHLADVACDAALSAQCQPCVQDILAQQQQSVFDDASAPGLDISGALGAAGGGADEGQPPQQQQPAASASGGGGGGKYDCTLPGLETFAPGQYEGVKVNYLSFATETSSPNFPVRARELENCTGGRIAFAEAGNVWEDPLEDLGSGDTKGFELYDGYFMSYSHFPEASALGLAETLNERIRATNERLKWEDILPKVRSMGEYRKDGQTNIDFMMYDGDFFVPVVRLDLLEKHDKSLPNTWEEVEALASYFHGKDLNDDGVDGDYGFCHFPRKGAGYWDWWWPEAVYSTWATFDQTRGIEEGFFFDDETMEPRTTGGGFKKAAEIWKSLWRNGADGCITDNFVSGKCAIGFSPPGCWKGVFLNPDGVHRKDENGTVIWKPRLKNGDVVEPYRIRPFGSTKVFDRATGALKECTEELCPAAEPIPAKGHGEGISNPEYAARADAIASVLKPSPLAGKLINRAPFYWSGGLGTLIRRSSEPVKKDLMWDFFVYTNSPATSKYDVANYASWLDSWRTSQLAPGDNFVDGGWSVESYEEHASVMFWALGSDANGALNLRIPALAKYTRDTVGEQMDLYIGDEIALDELSERVSAGWRKITDEEGKLNQLDIYRAALGSDPLTTVEKCRLHREEMDRIDPATCKEDDDNSTIVIIVLCTIVGAGILAAVAYFSYKRYKAFQAIRKAHEQLMESTLNEATRTLYQLDYPLHLIRASDFVKSGSLVRHEIMRNQHRLVVLDNISDVDKFIETGRQIVFFSHQWTSFSLPDPSNTQYDAMVNAMRELASQNGWGEGLDDVYVWVDYSCIPQANPSVQNLAIRSLAVYASSATYFVVVAPDAKHADLDDVCDLDTYQRRMWCRAEQVCHSMRNGTRRMFLAVSKKRGEGGEAAVGAGSGKAAPEFHAVQNDFFLESLHVFNGELTCCRFEHKGMETCDRQSLVVPILGLYGELLRAAHEGIKEAGTGALESVEAFLREIERRQEEVFPRTFKRVMWRKNKRVVEEVTLFGDLVERMNDRIKGGTMYVNQKRGVGDADDGAGGGGGGSALIAHGAGPEADDGGTTSNFVRHGAGPEADDGGGTTSSFVRHGAGPEGGGGAARASTFVRHGAIRSSNPDVAEDEPPVAVAVQVVQTEEKAKNDIE